MLRFLQLHEYEMIIAIVFLHCPDLQNRQLPLECRSFTLAVKWQKVTKSLACMPAPRTDMCTLALGRAEGQGRESHSLRRKLLKWVHEVGAEGAIMQAPGFPKPLDAEIPPPSNCLSGLRS